MVIRSHFDFLGQNFSVIGKIFVTFGFLGQNSSKFWVTGKKMSVIGTKNNCLPEMTINEILIRGAF